MESYVEFPNLGLKFGVSDVLFQFNLFGTEITIKWYGLIIAIGFLLAILYAFRRIKDFKIDGDRMIDVVLVSALFAFIGARLYYVFFSDSFDYFMANPVKILYIWEGGLGIYGGIIMAFLTALWMCKLRKVNTLAMFDLASLGFLIGQGIGRWGNFFNQEAFGSNTDLPWGMTGNLIKQGLHGEGFDPSKLVHPTFLYESLWCLVGFLLLHIISKKFYKFNGQIFAMYLIWYAAGRFVIEGLRTDSLMLGTMKISQLVAVLAIIGGIVLLFICKGKAQQSPENLFETESTIPLDAGIVLSSEGEEETTEEDEEKTSEEENETEEETVPEEETISEEEKAASETTEDEENKES